jgi:hypothetical protein
VKLGGGKARRQHQQRTGDGEAERRFFEGNGQTSGADDQRDGERRIGLGRQGEIDQNAAGEEDGKPEEPAVGFGCQASRETGNGARKPPLR